MSKIAIISILFDYPDTYTPIFSNKIIIDIDPKDYYILRYKSENNIVKNESYYFKFTYFRIKKFVNFIKDNIVNKYDYFIMLDATDVAYVGNIYNIPKIMEEYGCDTLFGSELNLWPTTDFSYLYDSKMINDKNGYKFLNAGVFCSKPDSFIRHCNTIISRGLDGLCDQGNWQIEYLLNNDICIDYKTKLVLNTFLAKKDIDISNNLVKFKINTPIFVHDNGGYHEDTIKLVDYFI